MIAHEDIARGYWTIHVWAYLAKAMSLAQDIDIAAAACDADRVLRLSGSLAQTIDTARRNIGDWVVLHSEISAGAEK